MENIINQQEEAIKRFEEETQLLKEEIKNLNRVNLQKDKYI